MPLADLLAVCPPPSTPSDVPTSQQWLDAEAAVGIVFPDDYNELLSRFGSGCFGVEMADGEFFDLAFTLSPGSERYDGELAVVPLMKELTKTIGDIREMVPEQVPDFAWPEPGGLLYVGGTTTGHCIYWKTEGAPGDWSCAVCDRACDEWFYWPGDLTSLLAELVTRRVPDWILEGTNDRPLVFRDLDTLEAGRLA